HYILHHSLILYFKIHRSWLMDRRNINMVIPNTYILIVDLCFEHQQDDIRKILSELTGIDWNTKKTNV
ncbi:hypothetical protein DERP_000442, partial [Dermatophagoides pteronyssinus]